MGEFQAKVEGERQSLLGLSGWLNALPVAVSVHRGPAHVFEYANPMMEVVAGVGDLRGRAAADVLHNEDLLAQVDGVYQTGSPWFASEVPLEVGAGASGRRRRWFSWQLQATHDAEGAIDGVTALAWDVTDVVLARQRSGEGLTSGRRVDSLLRSLDVVVYELKTRPARMVYISSGARKVLGYDRKEWEKTTFWDKVVHPDDREACLAKRRSAIAALEDHVLEYRVLDRGGVLRWMRDRTQVRDDPKGEGVVLRGVIIDITEQKTLETEARTALERELESQRLQSMVSLAAGIAVDFEDLLVSIGSCASLLELELHPDHPSRRMVRDVLRRCDVAQDRVQRLQAFAGVGGLSASQVDLSDLTRECLRLQVQGRGSRPVYTELTPDLPPVGVDPTQLHSLLDGLVANGLEAVGDQSGEVRVSTDLVDLTPEEVARWSDTPPPPPGRYVRLAVSDDGCGMTDEVRRRAFEPFFSTKGPGRGLGMPSALGIAQAAGGSVRVDSQPGKGSRVEVLFPVRS